MRRGGEERRGKRRDMGEEREAVRMLQVGKMKECRLKTLKHRYRCTYLDSRYVHLYLHVYIGTYMHDAAPWLSYIYIHI